MHINLPFVAFVAGLRLGFRTEHDGWQSATVVRLLVAWIV